MKTYLTDLCFDRWTPAELWWPWCGTRTWTEISKIIMQQHQHIERQPLLNLFFPLTWNYKCHFFSLHDCIFLRLFFFLYLVGALLMGLKMQSLGRIRSQLRWKVQFMGKKTYVRTQGKFIVFFVVPSTTCHLLLACKGRKKIIYFIGDLKGAKLHRPSSGHISWFRTKAPLSFYFKKVLRKAISGGNVMFVLGCYGVVRIGGVLRDIVI